MPLAFSQWHLYRLDFMVRPAGLEPATFWFVAKHSIQLSYERTMAESKGFEPSIQVLARILA